MTDEDLRHHFDVLAEHIDRRSEAIAEAVILLNEKVDRGFAEVGEFRREVWTAFDDMRAAMRFSSGQIDQRVADLARRDENLERRVDEVHRRIDDLEK